MGRGPARSPTAAGSGCSASACAASAASRRRSSCQLFRAVGDRAARALLTTQLISDLRRTRERFARILEVLGEAVTVQAADGRMVYANTAAARLVGCATPEELLATPATELTERFEITDADGNPVGLRGPARGAGCWPGCDAPPLLTRSRHRASGRVSCGC